jgi:hypothetical protein
MGMSTPMPTERRMRTITTTIMRTRMAIVAIMATTMVTVTIIRIMIMGIIIPIVRRQRMERTAALWRCRLLF